MHSQEVIASADIKIWFNHKFLGETEKHVCILCLHIVGFMSPENSKWIGIDHIESNLLRFSLDMPTRVETRVPLTALGLEETVVTYIFRK